MSIIGIDVGGTNIKFGLIDGTTLVKEKIIPTNTFDVVKQIINGSRELVDNDEEKWNKVQAIGVGFPGLIVETVVEYSANLGLEQCYLKNILEDEFGKPVVVLNDADMAGIAEFKLGAGKDSSTMIMLTVGTGLGGAIVLNGKTYAGLGGSGEFGHVIIESDGRECGCGMKGCAEQYISMSALDRDTKKKMKEYPNSIIRLNNGQVYSSELERCYTLNDRCAVEVVDKYVKLFGDYLLGICNIFRPETIVIGGGLSYSPKIIGMIEAYCSQKKFGFPHAPKTKIVVAKLGNRAGMLGACACFDIKEDGKVEISNTVIDDVIDAPVTYTKEMLDKLNEKLHN